MRLQSESWEIKMLFRVSLTLLTIWGVCRQPSAHKGRGDPYSCFLKETNNKSKNRIIKFAAGKSRNRLLRVLKCSAQSTSECWNSSSSLTWALGLKRRCWRDWPAAAAVALVQRTGRPSTAVAGGTCCLVCGAPSSWKAESSGSGRCPSP